MQEFEVGAGSVAGRSHTDAGRNNQDSFYQVRTPDYLVAAVTDGCTGGLHSEVGAQLGCRLIVSCLADYLRGSSDFPKIAGNRKVIEKVLERVRRDVLAQIRILSNQMGHLSEVIDEYFLFTVVGTLVTPESVAIFSLGDGLYALNGEITRLGPFEKNAPPYLGYGINGSSLVEARPELLNFKVECLVPSAQVESLVIATDGAVELGSRWNSKMPGKNEIVGPLSQFWEEDRYFKNPDEIRRRLGLINRTVVRLDDEGHLTKEVGILSDDTTIFVLRRKLG